MTNEEHMEEIYYEAHTQGFIDQLRQAINEITNTIQKISHNDAVFMAYDTLLKNGVVVSSSH